MKIQTVQRYLQFVFAAASGALLAGSVQAGGYVVPVVQEPYAPMVSSAAGSPLTWTGPYAGLSAGRAKTKSKALTERELSLYDLGRETQEVGNCDGFPEGLIGVWGKGDTDRYNIVCDSLLKDWLDPEWWKTQSEGARDVSVLGYSSEEEIKRSHTTYGVFAGYRHQWPNNFVGGVEASYIHSSDYDSARLMGQAGYAFGRVLPYLTVGYDFEEEDVAYGVGIDAALTNRLIGGVAYTKAGDTDRIEARLGWKF